MAKRLMNEQQFASYIYKLVMESIQTLSGFMPQEKKEITNKKYDNSKGRNKSDIDNTKNGGPENGETEKEKKIRMSVEKMLKQPGINMAAYGYKEYNGGIAASTNGDTNDKKDARKWIADRVNHAPDSNGNPQYFNSKEAIKLYNDLSGGINNLSEGKKTKLKEKKIKLSEEDLMYMVNESVKKLLKENTFTSLDNGAFTNSEMPSDEFWAKYENIKDECDACSEEMFEIEEKLEEIFDGNDMAAIDSIFAAVSNSGSGDCDENQTSIARKMLEKLYQKYGPDAFSYAYAMYDNEYSY